MLDRPAVQTALRRAAEDADGEVRALAFRLSLYTRAALVGVLRGRDAELDRQLKDVEGVGVEQGAPKKTAKGKARAAGEQARPLKGAAGDGLTAEDYEPLLQATASRALDTCLRGARGLAMLGDERALGLLLQLSREQDAGARVEVARALGALADPRGAGRLRSLLFDADAAVRDAAFSALEGMGDAEQPLAAAEAALGAPHEDVRRRGLQAVIAACRRKLPQDAREAAWPLMVRALNDASAAVRGEAFKAAVNLQICGGGVNTLRFAMQSVHPEVRREVLTEAMAAVAEPWAWGLLLEFLGDADPKLREEAFEFAVKRNKELEPLAAALRSPFADVRKRAVDALVKRHSKAAQALLATALADADKDVRQAALAALIGDDVDDALRAALSSEHDDVRARAARALARHGDAEVLGTLARLVSAPEPPVGPVRDEWIALVESALDGVAELGDAAVLASVEPLLESAHAAIRKAAGRALAWVAMGEHPGALSRAMRHADPQVKYHAALGLTLGGDASDFGELSRAAAPLVFSAEGAKVVHAKERIAAALALGPAGEDQLVTLLDHADERARVHAFLLLMLLELKDAGGVPARCLSCLASRDARTRLRAARALDSYRDPALFLQFVKSLFDDRGEEKPWDVSAHVVDALASLVTHGSHRAKARTAMLLGKLFKEEQGAFDRAWAIHERRFAAEIARLKKDDATATPTGKRGGGVALSAAPRYSAERLEELAFGAYVGLVREQGGSYGAKELAGMAPQIARVRQTALRWVAELARRNAANAGPARAVFVQAMGDPNQPVRVQAFDHLRELGMDATALAAEALGTGHTDLGVRGLELLSGATSAGAAAGQAVLEQAMLSRTDELATEAAKRLMTRRPAVDVANAALGAAYEPLRLQAVARLAEQFDKAPDAPARLRGALSSKYAKVREAAALELARKQDPAAFEPLVELLRGARDAVAHQRIGGALLVLRDPRTAEAFLDRLENDASGTANAEFLLGGVASLRRPESADRTLAMAAATANAKLRRSLLASVYMVSGYDQRIEDPEDQRPEDRAWLAKQAPRHDAVLAKLLDRSLELAPAGQTMGYVPAARWAPGKDVDAPLARMAAHPDENLRRAAVEAIAFRLRRRGGPAEPLLAALAHRDPQTQFLAAEGLARGGRAEGLSVLLAAVDSLPTLPLRLRAVRALGELGDPRGLDTLLRLATEDAHVLQGEAAQAIGHLGRSADGPEIFKLLERLSNKGGAVAADALRGLRWLGTREAWQVVRKALADPRHGAREVAAEVLGDDDDPATRDLLLKTVATESDLEVGTAAFRSARRLMGESSLEPHYAWLQNPLAECHEDGESVEVLAKRGDAKRMFEIMPRCPAEVRDALANALLAREAPPVAEAVEAVTSPDARTARIAARLLGRAGRDAPAKARAGLDAGLDKWLRAWDARRGSFAPAYDGDEDDELRDDLTPVARAFLWAAGRVGAAEAPVIAAATRAADDATYRPLRREAVNALDQPKPSAAAQTALETVATGDDASARALAIDILARRAPTRAARLADRILGDRVSFDRLARDLPDEKPVVAALHAAAANVHYQGVAAPALVTRSDAAALSAVAVDGKLSETTRIGAVEALGRLANPDGERQLEAVGKSDAAPVELRKAAWRALRRSKRARATVARHAGTEARA
jgi:ParB family chromosome partitioning protein